MNYVDQYNLHLKVEFIHINNLGLNNQKIFKSINWKSDSSY